MVAGRTSPRNGSARAEPYPSRSTAICPKHGKTGTSLPTPNEDKENHSHPQESQSAPRSASIHLSRRRNQVMNPTIQTYPPAT
ncbi:hypothetical protein K458DRAFT_195381 [Lentithecium fluviatile CBS 122367]|uniref:Uncharacterized protein n=1 Tax=Lentithecium fluviatile CBS 122367 TaxID=1168545 RepID=A0A6G1ICX8_9PLEO|nr:hypothetical protein K458DRAFT_195381 [Lentithecium fluviatile CBS 122367]